jgi:cysteine desulfurase
MEDEIYLDYAATTPLAPAVLAAMTPYFTERFYNASSRYAPATDNKRDLENLRSQVAALFGASAGEIIFTSGGSESDNLALKGVAFAQQAKGRTQIITTPIEHHAVLNTAKFLEEYHGFEVVWLPVTAEGKVDPQSVAAALTTRTALVSVMYANNEVGTIEPIAEIGRITHGAGVPFHTDAVQAGGVLPLDVNDLNVDLLSLSAHKFYGPKGVGLLYVRRGTPFLAQMQGGEQERGRRAGTENLANIAGLVAALQRAYYNLARHTQHLTSLRDRLITDVRKLVPNAILTGAEAPDRLPGHASFCFEGVEGEAVLVGLEEHGILCSSGSACAAGSTDPSHVLLALGFSEELAHTAVRFTLGNATTLAQIERVLEVLPQVINQFVG